MKPNSIKLLLFFLISFFLSPFIFKNDVMAQTSTGTASGVATFHSIGLYWSGSGGSASTVCNVQYRVAGSGSAYKNGYPLVFDSRGVGGRPANEYRGSLVNLTPGTTYEIVLTAGSATNTVTVATWSENFPVGSTTTLSSSTTISTSGTSSAYRVYTGSINGGTNNLYIDASYIIIRNMTLTAAGEDAIVLGPNAHDVVIEGCDISGWGYVGMGSNNQAAVRTKGFSYNALNITRIVIQRNKIHDSRDNSNSWDAGGHPLGPNGINFEHAGGNQVIRYNEVYNTVPGKKYMDGIGGADNFTFDGFPNANSDVYANKVSQCYDDGLEIEGADCNVRIWGNFTDDTFTGISCATNSVGPLYIFNNVSNMSVRSPYGSSPSTIDAEDRGPFNKCGSQDATYRGGRTYLFHNTILQPVQSGYAYPRGMGGSVVDNGGGVINVYSRNNIWQTYKSDHPAIGEWQTPAGNGNTYDYDLWNLSLQLVSNSEAGSHMIQGSPTYVIGTPVIGDPNPAGYFLASGSKGLDAGVVLNNFNDGYFGSAPDIGAYEVGKPALQFGVNAYLNTSTVTANAGSNVTLTLPTNSTTLTGSGTTTSGTITGYAWSYVSGPTTYTIASSGTASTALTGLVQGTYVFKLTVTNSIGVTGTANVTVTVNAVINQPPTANAGSDITLTLPTNSTSLVGSGSDPDGTISSYAWARVSGPTTFTLGTPNAVTTALTGLVQGVYTFKLTVTDNGGATASDTVKVTVNPAVNQPPTANAGADITITLPTNSTSLVGSGTDLDGTITGYAWARVSGPTTFTLGTLNAATTALTGLVQGTYTFKLTVTDNGGATASDTVKVTVNAAANQPPTANAGNNITITLPANSTSLVGSGTDPDGTITGYAWARVSGPTTFTLGTPNAATTSLTGLVQGTYTFRLTVTDNSGATASDTMNVIVNPAANQPPTANAGNNITITLPTNSTQLVGSGTDPDGTIVSYAWSKVSGPATSTIASPNAATTALTGLVQGVYTFRLTVTDNSGATATDDVIVTINAAGSTNQPPISNAGNNITLNLPTNSTTLNGTASFDPDGTIVSYSWAKVSGPSSFTLGNANSATTTLSNLTAGTYVFELTVTDNGGATDQDNITIVVSAVANQTPIANAGANIAMTLPLNSTNLNGGGSSDPDGIIVTFAWSKVSGPANYTLSNSNEAATGLTNLVAGVYTFRLTVTDNNGATSTDDITVTVLAAPNQAPTANAGSDITLTLPINSTILTGSGYDPDGTITSYAWSRISGPTTYTFANANAAATGLNGLVQGTYVFRLTVTDNSGATATDNVTVIVNPVTNQAPTANAGADITITLPTNTTTLYGSGNDPDGTIASYTWVKVSGPATFTIANTGSATTGLYNLVQGVYVFRLTVTDNSGATATDNVILTVNTAVSGSGNQPPVARTENDITITLPTNYTQVHGNTSSDPDGVIVSYEWTEVSGPSQAIISSGASSIATVSDLTTGIYTFELKVTDDKGATSTKTMSVTVENQKSNKATVNVYPNPTNGIVNIQYVANVNGKFQVTIYDANRRLIKNDVLDKTQVSVTKAMDLSSYESGVYFIQIISPDSQQKITAKVVKM
jgi:ribosomal protein L14